jgi:hypothetical protein
MTQAAGATAAVVTSTAAAATSSAATAATQVIADAPQLSAAVARAATAAAAQVTQDFCAMAAGQANAAVAAAGYAGAEAAQLSADMVRALRAAAPDWSELIRIEDVSCALGLPELPPEINDTDSPPHDGEVWVVDASAEPPDSQREVGADEDVIYYTNGMMTPPKQAKAQAEELSRRTGKPVVLVYSAREGFVQDVLQGTVDKLDPFGLVNHNPATDAEADLMYQAAKNGEERHFVAHSRGTIVTRNALMRTHARLYSEYFVANLRAGQNPVQANAAAMRHANDDMQNIHVVSAAGAAWSWPPYANVDHISNVQDPIPNAFGLNVLCDPRETFFELFGQEIDWLPTSDRLDITNENDASGIGHDFTTGYLDDILLAL